MHKAETGKSSQRCSQGIRDDRIASDLEPTAREMPSRQVESLPIRSTFELPPVYLRTVSRTLELSLQSSLQLSLTVLVCYRSRGKYLALGGVYHPLWAALSSNPTPRKGPNAPRSETQPCPTGLAPSMGDGPGQGDLDIRAQGANGPSQTPHCTLPK